MGGLGREDEREEMGFTGTIQPLSKGAAAVQFNPVLACACVVFFPAFLCVDMHVGVCMSVHFNLSVWTQGCRTEAAELSDGSHCIADTWPGVARHTEMCVNRPRCSDCTAKQKLNVSVSR